MPRVPSERAQRQLAIREHQRRAARGGVPPPDISSWPTIDAATTAGYRRQWMRFVATLPGEEDFRHNILRPAEIADRIAAERAVLGRDPNAADPDDWLTASEAYWEIDGQEDHRLWARYMDTCMFESARCRGHPIRRLIGTKKFCCRACFRRIKQRWRVYAGMEGRPKETDSLSVPTSAV